MPLKAGDKFSQYEIVGPIGAGGMGEVYRARDTRLKRDVALKVLPESFAHDSERMARFQREAEVLASLNHPNIAHIYGVEDRALVMELVEGAEPKGPMPFDEAWKVASQIAIALDYAHDKGVVHRDLKPANVKVAPDGVVKLLDFGLAKAFTASPEASNQENSPTLTLPATQVGVILGTAAYMSPEQARGRPVDKRADIWAFGVVLYEMLTGKRLFAGEDLTETLASVMKERPDLSEVPAPARRLIERCLEKDPKKRLRDIGDMELVLGEGSAPVAAPAAARFSRLPWVAVGTLAAALGVALWAPWRETKPVERPLARLDVDLGEDVSLPTPASSGSAIAISRDGTRLAYLSGTLPSTRLFTRRLDQARATELPGTQSANYPFFSPDGLWVGFVALDKLYKVSVEGGSVVPIGEANNFGNASWGEDGNIIASDVFGKGLVRYAAAGGPPVELAGLRRGEAAVGPQILPGGKALLFTVAQTSADVNQYTIDVLTLADGHRKVVARGGASARYVAAPGQPGHLIFVKNTTLFAVPFDLDKLETRGTPVPLLDDMAIGRTTGFGQFDWSPGTDGHGVLVYRRKSAGDTGLLTLQWVDSAGNRAPLPVKSGAFGDPRLSPDGGRIALMATEGGRTDIWVYDVYRDAMTRLTFGGGFFQAPVWSPDGRYIVYDALPKGISQLRADGASQPQPLIETNFRQIPWSFTPDGKRLAYEDESEGRGQIWTVPLEEQVGQLKAGKPQQFLKSSFNDRWPSFSPDGRWLAYGSDESGKYEVYVRAVLPSSRAGGKWQVSNNGGSSPKWSRNGHELLYRSGIQVMSVSYTVNGDTFVAGKPRVWIEKLGTVVSGWDLAPDGKRVLVLSQAESAEQPKPEHEVVFLANFFDDLRRRAPMGK